MTFRREAADQPAPESADAKPALQPTTREELVQVLMKQAREGNIAAVRELLDRPGLLKQPEPEKHCPELDAKYGTGAAGIKNFFLEIRRREMLANPNYWPDAFDRFVNDRFENESLPHHSWQQCPPEFKKALWNSFVKLLLAATGRTAHSDGTSVDSEIGGLNADVDPDAKSN